MTPHGRPAARFISRLWDLILTLPFASQPPSERVKTSQRAEGSTSPVVWWKRVGLSGPRVMKVVGSNPKSLVCLSTTKYRVKTSQRTKANRPPVVLWNRVGFWGFWKLWVQSSLCLCPQAENQKRKENILTCHQRLCGQNRVGLKGLRVVKVVGSNP